MDTHWEFRRRGEKRLESESGRTFSPSGHSLALVVPSPYPLAMASLGVLWAYERINAAPGWSCERLFAPEMQIPWRAWPHAALCTLETRTPLSEFSLIALSLCAEAEISTLLRMLLAAGIEPLRARRSRRPLIVAGGPLALVAPQAVGAIADVVFLGDTETTLPVFLERLAAGETDPETLCFGLCGLWVPDAGPPVPECVLPAGAFEPAVSHIVTAEAEFGARRLVEVARGCSRACAFCMMSRHARPCGMRPFSLDAIRAALGVPGPAVGLVGAAVSDHPHLTELVEELVDAGTNVSLSSVRADRASRPLLEALARGGLKTLTLGLDGASERLRTAIDKQCSEATFLAACENAAAAGIGSVKVYCILGYPDETDDDVAELANLLAQVSRQLSLKVSLSALVPKPGTPLENAPLPAPRDITRRERLLRRALRGVKIQGASWKEAQIEYEVDHFQESDIERLREEIAREG